MKESFGLSLDQVKAKIIQLQELLHSNKISAAKTGNKTRLLISLFLNGKTSESVGA
jgi:hypothetical protein